MSLSVDNIIGIQAFTTSSTTLQASQLDVYNGTTNFHRLTSNASSPLLGITIPNASGIMTLNTATQTLTNKMNHAQVGSATDPSYAFVGGVGFNDMGFFTVASGIIGISTSGVQRASISDTLISSLIPVQATIFQATSGTYPTCAFTNSTNNQTGLYFGTTTTCGIACNGGAKFTFGSSTNTSFQPITVIDGAANNLSINFSSSSTTGIYRNSPGDVRFAIAGNASLGIQSQGIFLYGSIAGNNGLYNATKFSYYEEFTESVTFTCGNQNVASTIRYKRIGNMVQLQFSGDLIIPNPSTAQQYTTSTAIALRFRPAYKVWWYQPTFDNTLPGYTIPYFGSVDTNGVIQYNRVGGAGGATTSGATFYNPCISYSLV